MTPAAHPDEIDEHDDGERGAYGTVADPHAETVSLSDLILARVSTSTADHLWKGEPWKLL